MLAKPKNKKLDSQNKHSQTHAHKDYHVSFLHTHTHTQKTKKKKTTMCQGLKTQIVMASVPYAQDLCSC